MNGRRAAVLALLLLQFGLLVAGMPRLALTYDEPSHLTSGYTALARGLNGLWTMRDRGHPVLVDAWAALPLYIGSPQVELERLPGWQQDYKEYVRACIAAVGPLPVVEIAGRVPIALLTIVLSATVYRWAQTITHGRSGWIALAVLVFDPTLLAHGRLATNDVGVTALGTLGLFLTWRWARIPKPVTAVVSGVVLGLTCLAKASGILWLLAALLTMPLFRLRREAGLRQRIMGALWLGLAAGITIWAAYGFSFGPLSDSSTLSVPAPLHWAALFFQTTSAEQRLSYALGRLKMGGWWWYFPLAFVLKNPIPLLIVFASSLGYTVSRQRVPLCAALPLMWMALYSVVAIWRGPNIGYRHMLPVHPVIYLSIALAYDATRRVRDRLFGLGVRGHMARAGLGALYIWYVWGALTSFPNEIAYFNAFAGSDEDKHKYLVSSNLDWGQMTKRLAEYLQAHAAEDTYLAYEHVAPYALATDGHLPPGPDAEVDYAPFHPEPGLYLIGATSLHIPRACCGLGLDSFSFFRNAEPSGSLGGAILIYDITPDTTPAWLVQCGALEQPLSSEAVRAGFHHEESLRELSIDCTQAWLYPGGEGEQGTYAVATAPSDEGISPDPFIQHHLASTRLSYQQPAGFILQPFSLYERKGVIPLPEDYVAGAASADARPATLKTHAAPRYTFEGMIEFLGITILEPQGQADQLEITTWWRVLQVPEQQFSVMAHAVTPDGDLVSIGDALAADQASLQPEDILAQRHILEMEVDQTKGELWLRTGIYWLESLDRWSIDAHTDCDAVFAKVS